MVVSVKNNPIERDGMDSLCRMIAYNYNPTALYLGMTEFADERNYVQLLRALTLNQSIRFLSLAGTATRGTMSLEGSAALSAFFSQNNTIRYLDFSGYSALLDEAQLGQGFSRSLAGLRDNKALRHLRIRSQELNEDVGGLGTALAENHSLLTLDVQDNSFSLSNLAYLVRNLDKNTAIVQFAPFSDTTLQAAIDASIDGLLPPQPKGRPKAPRVADADMPAAVQTLAVQLREEWGVIVNQMETILKRNRGQGSYRERDVMERMDDTSNCNYTALFGGLAAAEEADWEARNLAATEARSRQSSSPHPSLAASPRTRIPSRQQISGQLAPAPHHVSTDEAIESPTDTGGEGGVSRSTSGFSTTPDLVGSLADVSGPGERGGGGVLGVPAEDAERSPENPQTPVDGTVEGLTEWDDRVMEMMTEHSFWDGKAGRVHAGRNCQDEDGNEADRESV
jgi:hypothetical protein